MVWLGVDAGGDVVAGVLAEIAQIPIYRQQPELVALALASARVVNDPESARWSPAAMARLLERLNAIHREACE